MRWTREHWAKLDKDERAFLMELLKSLHRSNHYGGWNVPEDVESCGCCGEFVAYCNCYKMLEMFTAKMGVPCPDI